MMDIRSKNPSIEDLHKFLKEIESKDIYQDNVSAINCFKLNFRISDSSYLYGCHKIDSMTKLTPDWINYIYEKVFKKIRDDLTDMRDIHSFSKECDNTRSLINIIKLYYNYYDIDKVD